MRCVITDYMGDDARLEEQLLADAGFDVFVAPRPEVAAWGDEAVASDAILTRHAPIGADLIEQLERCRVISRYGTGHDNIAVDAALARGIVVTNVPDYCTPEVAEHTMMLLLAAARHTVRHLDSIRFGEWTPSPLPPMRRIAGRRLGLIGLGRIGAAVAQRARAFGIEVHVYDPYIEDAPDGVTLEPDLEAMLARSDFVSLHTPLTSETAGILDRDRIALLPAGAIVVNASRGGLVDLDALIDALDDGHLASAALDVTPEEPPGPDHRVRFHPDVMLTPHVGYFSLTSVEEAKRRSVGEIVRVMRGEPPENPVEVAP